MSILRKIFNIGRGHAHEAGEAFVDANKITLLQQEVRDAEESIKISIDSLASIRADQMANARRIADLKAESEKYRNFAREAKSEGKDTVAIKCAEHIVTVEAEMESLQEIDAQYEQEITSMQAQVKEAQSNVDGLRRNINKVKSTERIQQVQVRTSKFGQGSNAKVANAMSTLKDIEAKQAKQADKMKAQRELSTTATESLDQQLSKAGIGTTSKSAQSILDDL